MSGPGADATEILVTHNYVVVEAAALVQRRLGTDAVRVLLDAWLPALSVVFVDETLHRRGEAAYLGSLGRRVSLVDAVSFELVRDARLDRAFAFDDDFAGARVAVVP
jgi:predicted nucleic acid-binding protein